MSFLKYLPMLLRFKDVAQAYKKEGLNVTTKPFWESRRFVGITLIAISAILANQFGIKIEESAINSLGDVLIGLAEVGSAIYGVSLIIIGYFKRDKSIKLGIKTK